MTVRASLFLVFVVFAVALAYQVANRLSTDALNVALGALCGMAASIPVSLGLLIALTRQREERYEEAPRENPERLPFANTPRHPIDQPRPAQQTPVIIIAPPHSPLAQGPGFASNLNAAYQNYWPPQMEEVIEGRDWKIIGDDA